MIYLDTHVVIWLYEGLLDNFSEKAKKLLITEELIISGMVSVELQLLFEIKRIKVFSEKILSELNQTIGLSICKMSFADITKKAINIHWTRDPFDRIIVANSLANKTRLLTKDKLIHKHFNNAVW